jgi:hypothetical protein
MASIAGLQDFRQEGPPGDIGVFQAAASIIIYPFTFSGTTYSVAQRMGIQGSTLVSQGTDAATVIQSAINALTLGGLIIIKIGIYNISSSIIMSSNTSLIGESKTGAWTGVTAGVILKAMAGLTDHIIKGTDVSNIKVSNIHIDMSLLVAGAYDALHFTGISYSSIHDITIYDATNYGLFITRHTDTTVSKVNYIGRIVVNEAGSSCFYINYLHDSLMDFIELTNPHGGANPALVYRVSADFTLNRVKCYGSSDTGAFFEQCQGATIIDLETDTNHLKGTYLDTVTHSTFIGGWDKNNGVDGVQPWGMYTLTCTYINILGRKFIDTGPATQTIGLRPDATLPDDYFSVIGCEFYGMATPISFAGVPRVSFVTKGNQGYVTENSGTATILNTTTSIVVAHGCDYTPSALDVSLVLTNNPTNDPGNLYVDTFGAANFTIHCRNDPGATGAIIAWAVRMTP